MKKSMKYIMLMTVLIILAISLVTIYNIAFATEKTENRHLKIEGKIEENLTGDSSWRNVATYSHIRSRKVNENETVEYEYGGIQDINTIFTKYVYDGTSVFRPYKALLEDTSVFCVREGNDFLIPSDGWYAYYTGSLKKIKTKYVDFSENLTNLFAYATTFSEKWKIGTDESFDEYMNYSSDGTNAYGHERAQHTIWSEVGNFYTDEDGNFYTPFEYQPNLYKAAKALDGYEAEVVEHGNSPQVSCGNQVGTILIDNNTKYKIGPFKMSDYAYVYSSYAEKYSGALMGGITAGKLVLNNGTEMSLDNSKIQYVTGKEGNNNRSGDYWNAPSNYNYPWPNSEFYIVVDRDSCGDATTLSKIQFTYQKTSADGEGWVISSYNNTVGEDNQEIKVVNDNQPLLVVKEAKVSVDEIDIESTVNVRITTDVSIDKYIIKVEHVGETNVTYGENEDRAHKTTPFKNAYSLKVESGDRVTFKIVLTNIQNEEVKFKIRDVLPQNYQYTIDTDISGWLVIPASGKKEIKITVDVKDITDTRNNTALIITRNKGNTGADSDSVDYPRTTSTGGPVVNIAEFNSKKMEDADYFTIKEYNVNIDKSIVEVQHVGNNEVVYSGNGRKNIDETSKSNNPVYVEYGDKVTYEIDIYNTSSPYVTTRDSSPYWSPDKIYVNIEDTLPNSYSDLQINVSNKTGTMVPASNGKFKINAIVVPKNEKTTVTVSLVVEEHDKEIKEENNVKIVGNVLNINKRVIKNNSTKNNTSDFYHINDYNISIHKYISEYDDAMTQLNNSNSFTQETTNFTDRYNMSENDKANRPLPVEKTEEVVYSLRLNNDSTSSEKDLDSGIKRATSVRPNDVTDVLDYGLTYKSVSAKVYKADGSDKYGDIPVTVTALENNTYRFTIENNMPDGSMIILDPGEYLIYYVTVQVTETNMYLFKLANMGVLTTLTDINHTNDSSRIVKNDQYNENTATLQTSIDYVKLKDLVISGKVWLDSDKDGYMGKNASGQLSSYVDYESNSITNIEAPSGDAEYAMKGITVKLYSVINDVTTLVRTTKTNENGLFTFGKKEDGTTWYNGTYSYDGSSVESEQRIPKATNKDTNRNYTANSEYIQYYVEYEYDGIAYKSTEVYSGTKNLNNDGSLNSDKYKIDSNADEFTKLRDEYDKNYEIIGYNKAYNGELQNQVNLEYEKDGHNSYLKVDSSRVMTARSFIVKTDAATLAKNCEVAMNSCGASRWKECVNHWQNWKGLIESGYFDESQFANTTQGRKEAQAYLKNLYNEVIKNLSSDGNTQITKYLWLFKPAVENDKPETEYLKYINLGLEEREEVDLSVVQDVYEVKNTVNGEEMTYWYNQNSYAKDGSSVDHDTTATEAFSNEFYMTGFKNNNSAITPYEFKYYLSDYNYKVDDYAIETVRNYKTKDSELNSEITFRIKVTNNAITEDEPYQTEGNKDIKVYTGINEVIEYFDNQFMNIEYNADGTVKTINIKTKDEDGYLIDTPLKIADAKFVLPNGTTIPATMEGYNTSNTSLILSNSSIYNANRTIDGYNTVYIRPRAELKYDGTTESGKQSPIARDIILTEGENVDILIKFIVDKDASRNLKLGLKTAIAEIGAYSTYYRTSDGTYYSAGLVDKDSNPGNFAESYNDISFDSSKNNKENDPYLKLYEDDTFKAGITLATQNNNERMIQGQVWDDARSEVAKTKDGKETKDGIQYIGDGKNGTVEGINSSEANSKAKLNTVLKNSDNTLKEKKDFSINDVGVKLVELVRVPIYDASGKITEERIYEETIKVNNGVDSIVEMRTGDNTYVSEEGKYILKGYIPGEYTVRFFYGDTLSEQMTIFNGQDYKSTTYQAGSEYADTAYLRTNTADGSLVVVKDTLGNSKKDTDKVLEILETKGLSDAKDDEIRRLETISFSETLNNNKTLVLRGMNSTNKELQKDETSMNAETVDFLVRAEKEKKAKKAINYQETMAKFKANERHPIENIDFGLQYRPEQQVALNKFVKNLTITTSDANTGISEALVNAKFNEYYGVVVNTDLVTGVTTYLGYKPESGSAEYETIRIPEAYLTGNRDDIKAYINNFLREYGISSRDLNSSLEDCKLNQDGTYQVIIAGTELDTENSIGLSNLQYVPNSLDSHDQDSIQGFVYLNIDDEIMQGAEIKIEYLFTGHNISEIDRVSKNLSVLRFKENNEVKPYYESAPGESYDAIKIDAMRAGGTLAGVSLVTTQDSNGENVAYSGSLTARNALFNEYYRYEVISETEANKDNNGKDVIYRVKHKTIGDTLDDYYGRYLGSTYYTGKVGNFDIVAELKIDKILDYVDNNLVFKQEDNDANSSDRFWSTTSSSELALGGYIDPNILEFEENTDKTSFTSVDDTTKERTILAIQRYSDKAKLEKYIEESTQSGLVVAAIKDYTDLLARGLLLDSEGVAYNTSERTNLALLQDLRTNDYQTSNDIVNADITKYLSPRDSKDEGSFGAVKIITSKIISAEDDTNNMSYENVGEIVEYSSVTGRITNLSTTLGNVKLTDKGRKIDINSPEYEEAKGESDTAAVEKITLTPPTGLSRRSTMIRTAVKGASYVGIVIVIIAIAVFGTFGGMKLYRKRKIK